MPEPPSKFTKAERAHLRQLAEEAWETELDNALEELFEDFTRWADDAMGAFELSERIHAFHNGAARELYVRYSGLDPAIAVARAIVVGLFDEKVLGDALLPKLAGLIEAFRSSKLE